VDGGLDDMSANVLHSTDFLLLGASCGQLPCPASLSVHPQSGAVRAPGREETLSKPWFGSAIRAVACLLACHSGYSRLGSVLGRGRGGGYLTFVLSLQATSKELHSGCFVCVGFGFW
jgi:hypothetical protein